MATGTTVINRVLRQLLSGTVEQRNKLAANVTASGTSVSVSYDVAGLYRDWETPVLS